MEAKWEELPKFEHAFSASANDFLLSNMNILNKSKMEGIEKDFEL